MSAPLILVQPAKLRTMAGELCAKQLGDAASMMERAATSIERMLDRGKALEAELQITYQKTIELRINLADALGIINGLRERAEKAEQDAADYQAEASCLSLTCDDLKYTATTLRTQLADANRRAEEWAAMAGRAEADE